MGRETVRRKQVELGRETKVYVSRERELEVVCGGRMGLRH